MLKYYDVGISAFVLKGFDPLEDAKEFGNELLPLVRQGVARRNRAPWVQATAAAM
jgi:alkanesulfonate monooxygenase